MSLNDPSTWRFLAGFGSTVFMPEDDAQHVIGLGANGSYEGIMVDGWGGTTTHENGLTSTQHAVRFAQELHRLGGLVHLQIVPWGWGTDPNKSWLQYEHDTIYNTGGYQDVYINWCKNVLGANGYPNLNPDICQIMNEIEGDNSDYTASPTFWANYVAFCNRFMAAMNAIKPNMIFTISSIPFWDLAPIANVVFNVPSGCKLIYDYHYYYSFDGVRPDAAHYGYDVVEQLPYWDGTDFALGKSLTYAKWLTGQAHMNSLLSQGKTIFFDEQGTHIVNPNFAIWMRDAIAFCVQNHIGFAYLDNTGLCNKVAYQDQASCQANGGSWGSYNHSPGAFWTVDSWNLNAIGQAWKQLVKPTPSATDFTFSKPYSVGGTPVALTLTKVA